MTERVYAVRIEGIVYGGECAEDFYVYPMSSELERDAALIVCRMLLKNFAENGSFEEYIKLSSLGGTRMTGPDWSEGDE